MKYRAAKKLSAVLALLAMQSTPTTQKVKIPVDRDWNTLVPMSEYVPSDDWCSWQDCPKEFRILDCWQCFQAQGKVCMDDSHNSLHHHLDTTMNGVVFCCKPDSTDEHCQTGKQLGSKAAGDDIKMICSPNSFGVDPGYETVMTGNRNHQMYAYCPNINQLKCGFPGGGEGTDMRVKAGKDKLEVQAHKLRYLKQGPFQGRFIGSEEAEYDSCYYEVIVDPALYDDWVPMQLHVKITEKSGPLNAFAYGGTSRTTARRSLIQGNKQVQVGQTFTVSPDEGLVLIAYPNDENEDEFYFEYWVDVVAKPEEGEPMPVPPPTPPPLVVAEETSPIQTSAVSEDDSDDGDGKSLIDKLTEDKDITFIILCAVAGCIFLTIVSLCVYWKCRKQKKIDPGMQPQDAGMIDLGAQGYQHTHQKSMELEELEEEVGGVNSVLDNEGNTNRQSSKDSNKQNGLTPKQNGRSPQVSLTQKYPGIKEQGTADDSWG